MKIARATHRTYGVGRSTTKTIAETSDVAVKDIYWNGGRGEDLHIVNGAESMDLRTLLVIDDDTRAQPQVATSLPDGVILIFIPYFIAAPVAGQPDLRGNFGVQVNTVSGVVKVTQAVPRIRSFLIEASVLDSNVAPAKSFSRFIRANAHGGIERIWLTSPEIHLHQNANEQRLTMLAQFDDGRMGQVNNIPGLTWATSAGVTVGVDVGTGKLTISAAAGNATITATLPAAYKVGPVAAAAAPTAKVFCLPPWSTARNAKLIGGSAGMAVRDDVRNFVMLSEGFRAGESAKFEKAAKAFTDFMRTDISARPFGLCSKRMNFWTVFVESQENGTSNLTPLLPLAGNRSEPVPDPIPTRAPPNPKSEEELVERVGYPTKDDRNKAGNMSAAAITAGFAAQTTEWNALYGAGLNANLTEKIYKKWVRLADLRIPDERDTAFGLRSGMWPNAEDPHVARSIGLHPFRTQRAHVDQLLSALKKDTSGTALGDLWGAGKVSRPHVLFICLGGARAGARSPTPEEMIAVSVETDQQPRIKKVGPGMRTELKPFAFPATVSLDARTTFVHESAHSFSLLDEYGERSGDFPATLDDEVKDAVNVQPVSKAMTGAKIDPAKLKWNLPRLDRAAMLVKQPTVTAAGDVDITVVAGQAKFGLGDVVLLRQRPLSPTAKVSKEITVTVPSAAVADGELVKLHGPAGAVTAADFPKESIAFVQKKAGAVKLNLIADEIAAHIKTTGVALNTAFGTPAAGYVCVPKDTPEWSSHWTVQIATNIPADPAVPGKALIPFRPTRRPYIVGAYEGGHKYHCGVLHPTGICMMRQQEIQATTKAAKPGIAYEFCAVCAYVLVDTLDPSKHHKLDKKFIADRHYKAKK
jgi:hypothetical protein